MSFSLSVQIVYVQLFLLSVASYLFAQNEAALINLRSAAIDSQQTDSVVGNSVSPETSAKETP
jgi:hypothetical protein